ncbi:winged helix-turn-helix transcriptional regulator [Planosporangium flavigriseum]|uniref:GntR family transcriptional regulator n=1 Tax=Planosporangium flavigriseum TaxID=373681 RepID=UPI001438DC95|nr:winged helix-turn-helix domain-containing protein [Planosporangium flavigriseum]NJC67081.1 winged helix-turn-helix transcriptional regulator [Planosporangium flavigriseum]
MDQVDHGSYVPVYQQLVAIMKKRIESGEFPPGRLIPSEKTLQQEYGVGRDTVRRVVEILREEGLIFTVPHRGSYVAER